MPQQPKNRRDERQAEAADRIVREIYMSAMYGVTPEAMAEDAEPFFDGERETEEKAEPNFRRHERVRRHEAAAGRKMAAKKAKKEKRPLTLQQKKERRVTAVCWVLLVAGLYMIAVFSDIGFIKKWRDIYIETAMGTMTHQWLATAFIPGFVIDEVMGTRTDIEFNQDAIDTDWTISHLKGADKKTAWKKLKKQFFDIYSEIDEGSFDAYIDGPEGDSAIDGEGYLLIDRAGINDGPTGIKTIHGDDVSAIDTRNGVVIIRIKGDDYVGRLAIVKDPSLVELALAKNFPSVGSQISEIAEGSGAVLAVNASGFVDPEGHGNGGQPYGLVIKDGKALTERAWDNSKTIGFDYDNVLQIGKYKEGVSLRDAVEFKPVLVLNGEKVISGSAGWGISPRTAIGQTKDGQVLIAVIDGRQVGYSIGCTMGDLADIMLRYGAYQSCNLDGGSSSIMYYNGREISRPSAANKEKGRRIPNAFIVKAR